MRIMKAFFVLCFLLFHLQARASDIVVMLNGSERSGDLQLCSDDQCRLSGKPIPISQIRAIFLEGQRKIIPGRSNAIVMRDGSVRDGRVTFVNRGTVDTDDEEIERSLVAAILFGGAAEAPVSDLLILRDRSVKKGALTACNAASCTLDGAITPFAEIEWVGLARADVTPPPSTADEVHKIDGTIATGRLSAIDATTVSTTRGRVPRAETAWVHVVAPTPAQLPQPGSFGAPPNQPSGPETPVRPPKPPKLPTRQPPTQPPSTGGTPPGGGAAAPSGVGRPGALWTGVIQARLQGTVDDTTSRNDVEIRVNMRERIFPLMYPGVPKAIGTYIRLDHEGTVVRNRFRSSGPYLSCRGEGTTTVSAPDTLDCSVIWIKDADVDTTPGFHFNVPRGASYMVCISSRTANPKYDIVCDNGGFSTGFMAPSIGQHPYPIAQSLFGNVHLDPQSRRFDNGAGKMQGSFSAPSVGAFTSIDVSWSICREGVQCSDPAPLPEAGDEPDPGRRADGTTDEEDCLTLARLIDGIRALREAYEAFETSFVEAERNRDQARDSIYGGSGTLAQYFTSLGSLAAEGLGGAFGDVIGLIGSAVGLAQDFSADNAAQAVLGLADTDVAFSPAAQEGVRNAIRKADAALEATDLDSVALRTYAEELGKSEAAQAQGKKVVKGLSVAVSIYDYGKKTDALADSIQSYLDYRSEASRDRASMDDIQDQMEQKQAEIDEARAALDGPCPDIPSTSDVPRRNSAIEFSSPYQLVQSNPVVAEPQVRPEEVRAAKAALSSAEARMASAVPWLLPFFARATDGVSPRMLRLLLLKAEPDLRAVVTDLETGITAGRDLERRLRQTSPGSTAARRAWGAERHVGAGYR